MVWENSLWSEMDRNWKNHDKYIYAYDANNRLVWSESYYWPETEADGYNWIGIHKDISAYDDQGNETHCEDYEWNKEWNNWRGVVNVTNIYNSNNKKISFESSKWSGYGWLNYYKDTWDYDTNDQCLLWESYVWSKEANVWITDYTTVYYYSEHTTTGIDQKVILQAQVYPNPVEDVLNIQVFDQSTIQQLTVADMSGRIVCRAQPNSAIYQLNAHGWIQGIYVVTITTPAKTTVQKVIKR